MKYHYLRALLFSQFNTKKIEALTGWKETDIRHSSTVIVPSFAYALNEEVSISPGTANFAALTLFVALFNLSDATLSRKADSILLRPLGAIKDVAEGRSFREFPLYIDSKDYTPWASNRTWTVTEGTMLSLGLKPTSTLCDRFEKVSYHREMDSWLLKEFKLRSKLAAKEAKRGGLGSSPISPGLCSPLSLFDWFTDNGFTVPQELYLFLKQASGLDSVAEQPLPETVKKSKSESPILEIGPSESGQHKEDALNPKARTTMLTLIYAFSQMRQIQYDTSKPRNGAVKRIQNAILDSGLEMSERTIRKYLKEALQEAERMKDKNV